MNYAIIKSNANNRWSQYGISELMRMTKSNSNVYLKKKKTFEIHYIIAANSSNYTKITFLKESIISIVDIDRQESIL